MIKNFVCFLLIVSAFSCGKQKEAKKENRVLPDSINEKVFVKNRYLYSDDFLNELVKDIWWDSICTSMKVIDDKIIYNSDTLNFPELMKIGKIYTLAGEKKGIKYKLMLTRVNRTDLKYYYFLNDRLEYNFSKKLVTLSLYFSMMKSDLYGDNDFGPEYLKFLVPDVDDSSFHIFLKTNHNEKLTAVFRKTVWLVRPSYIEDSPIMIEQ